MLEAHYRDHPNARRVGAALEVFERFANIFDVHGVALQGVEERRREGGLGHDETLPATGAGRLFARLQVRGGYGL